MTLSHPRRKLFAAILVFLFTVFEGVRVTLTPAFSSALTNKELIALSDIQYASLYVPFSLMAMISAIFSGFVIKKRGLYATFTYAIVLELGSLYFFGMALISLYYKNYAFVFLCVALALSGAGFGMILPVINTFVASLFPKKTTTAILSIYLGLSVGSFILFFIVDYLKQYIGMGLSILALCLIIFFFLFSFFEVFPKTFISEKSLQPYQKIWTLLLAMICVGILEGLFFNWSILYATNEGVNAAKIYLVFLIFFTVSQAIYAFLLYFLPFNIFFVSIPLLLVLSLIFGWFLFSSTSGVVIFSVVGFFLSANLPFTIAYGKKMFGLQPLVWGFLTAAYELGYGISSYAIGSWFASFVHYFFIAALIFAALIVLLNVITVRNNNLTQ